MAHKHMMNAPKSKRAGMPHYDETGNPKSSKKMKSEAKPKFGTPEFFASLKKVKKSSKKRVRGGKK